MNKDLYIVAIIFATICFGILNIQHNLELNKSNDNYIYMLNSMNRYAEELEYRIETMEKQNEILKDLRSSK